MAEELTQINPTPQINPPSSGDLKDPLDSLPSDGDLLTKINNWIAEASNYHQELKAVQEKSEDYYKGKQTKMDQVPSHLSNFVQNRIFESVETIVPIVTSRPAEFIAKSPDVSELGVERARKVQLSLSNLYEETRVPQKLEDASRSALIYRFGVMKYYWDDSIDDVNVKYVRPQRLILPRYGGRFIQDLPYVIEKIDMTYQEIKDFFGVETANDLVSMSVIQDGAEEVPLEKRIWTIYECWTNWWVAWKYESKILDKKTNPNFDFKNLENNFWKKARKPYILLAPFSLGKGPIPERAMVEQAMPIQDGLNVVGRIIINHATKMGNGVWLVDSSTMTKEESDQIRNEAGLILYGSGVANPNNLRRDTPPTLPQYMFELWSGLNASLDNLFGIHSTTRGERQGKETARGRVLLKEADMGRLDYIVREIDRAVQELGEGYVQMIKLFYTDSRKIKFLGVSEGLEVFDIAGSDVEDGLEIMVRSGSTLPKDEVTEADRMIQLWQMGAVDPITLFESLKFSDPMKSVERLMKWKMGTLVPVERPAPPAGGEVVPPEAPVTGLPPIGVQ